MSHLRARALGLPIIGGLLGIGGYLKLRRGRTRRRPTADELMNMDAATFDSFVRLAGLEGRVSAAMTRTDDVAK